jgi:hypothetical protein
MRLVLQLEGIHEHELLRRQLESLIQPALLHSISGRRAGCSGADFLVTGKGPGTDGAYNRSLLQHMRFKAVELL